MDIQVIYGLLTRFILFYYYFLLDKFTETNLRVLEPSISMPHTCVAWLKGQSDSFYYVLKILKHVTNMGKKKIFMFSFDFFFF